MNNYEKLYWLTRLDTIHDLGGSLVLISILGVAIYIIAYVLSWGDDKEALKKEWGWAKKVCIALLILSIPILTFVPTRNEAIVIMAGGKAMDYIQSDTSLSKVPYQTTSIISEYLDKTLKEMKEENHK